MRARFAHLNFNVLDLEKSLDFYDRALSLKPIRRKEGKGFTLVYLGDGTEDFELELTYLHDRGERYDLGECEFHLALAVDDMDLWRRRHDEMGCVCFENKDMGIYFIEDPDGYWIEIIPERRAQAGC